MSNRVGVPKVAASAVYTFARVLRTDVVPVGGTPAALDDAAIRAIIDAQGASFADGTAVDLSQADQELVYAEVIGLYVGEYKTDAAGTKVEVTTDDACVELPSGQVKDLNQNGNFLLGGSDADGDGSLANDPAIVAGRLENVNIPEGSGVCWCFVVKRTV